MKSNPISPNNFSEDVFKSLGVTANPADPKREPLSFLQPNGLNQVNPNSNTGAVERNLVDRNQILRTGLNNTLAANTNNRFDYNQIQGVKNNRFVTPEFLNQVEGMAQRLGTRPEYILSVMSFETGGTFNPGEQNGIGATGLIQFLPSTARGLGTTTDRLAQMSSTEQLRFVEKYFDQAQYKGKLSTLEGLYSSVLSGTARQNSDDVLFREGTAAYNQNPLDWNKDGRITAGEAVTPVAARMYGGIRAVQQKLSDAGFVPDNQKKNFADGTWGGNTSAAVKRFQQANNLPTTGLMDDNTGRRLFGLQPPTTTPTTPVPTKPPTANDVQRGSRGPAVEKLQDNLIKLGFMTSAQKATGAGIFGPKTEASLKAFQKSANLETNGKLDAATQNAMKDINLSLGKATNAKNINVTKGIQDRLVDLGYLSRAQVNTGYGTFGPQTEAAVKSFQAKNNIQQTGRVGEMTYRTLFSDSPRSPNSTGGTSGNVSYSPATNGRNYQVNPGILMTDALRPQLQTLADRYHQATGNDLFVTSGYRPPERQANAMFDLIQQHGTGYVRDLYANKTAVDQIISAYQNTNGSRGEAVAAMTRTINNQVGHGTYISSHLRSQALDFSTDANFSALSRVVQGMGGTILDEGNHYHVQF